MVWGLGNEKENWSYQGVGLWENGEENRSYYISVRFRV